MRWRSYGSCFILPGSPRKTNDGFAIIARASGGWGRTGGRTLSRLAQLGKSALCARYEGFPTSSLPSASRVLRQAAGASVFPFSLEVPDPYSPRLALAVRVPRVGSLAASSGINSGITELTQVVTTSITDSYASIFRDYESAIRQIENLRYDFRVR